jgi:hypothetical protein
MVTNGTERKEILTTSRHRSKAQRTIEDSSRRPRIAPKKVLTVTEVLDSLSAITYLSKTKGNQSQKWKVEMIVLSRLTMR